MTRHLNVTRDYPVTSRVSHATHTTPHHTLSLVDVVGGWFVAKKSSNAAACIALGRAKTDGDFVAEFGGLR